MSLIIKLKLQTFLLCNPHIAAVTTQPCCTKSQCALAYEIHSKCYVIKLKQHMSAANKLQTVQVKEDCEKLKFWSHSSFP